MSRRSGAFFGIAFSVLGSGMADAAPSVTMNASSNAVDPGEQSTLSYSSTDAETCSASSSPDDASFSVDGPSGSRVVSPTVTTTYAITCVGKKGAASTSQQITVRSAELTAVKSPTVTLSVKPTTVGAGQPATVAFTSSNASFCIGSSSPNDPAFVVSGVSGALAVRPQQTTTYTVRCKNGVASATASVTTTVTVDQIAFSETFSGAAATNPVTCVPDGQFIAPNWRSIFNGYGCNAVVALFDGPALSLRPKAALSVAETHSGLIAGPLLSQPINTQGSFTLEASLQTISQLRQGSAPNPWEVAWLLWDYVDNSHFYYFIPKPNGWELGKGDPAYPGNQRFLATGGSPRYPIGTRYVVKVTHLATASATTLTVFVNGALLTTFTDRERPYSGGLAGFYSEDALAYFPSLVLTTPLAMATAR